MSPKNISSVLSEAIEIKAKYDLRLLAQQLGTNYRSLLYWLRGEREIPASALPQICVLLQNYEPLDWLESQAGRIAFKIPDPRQITEKEFLAVSRLVKDMGSALESVASTLADGIVEERELASTVPKLEAVIRECASMKYLLEIMCRQKKRKNSD